MEANKLDTRVSQMGDKLLELLERGDLLPWRAEWSSSGCGGYVNVATGRSYSGQNLVLLWIDRFANRYSSTYYVGFYQAKDLGLRMLKGSKSCPILYPRFVKKVNEEGEEVRVLVGWSWANVFNLDCFEDTPEKQAILAKYMGAPDDTSKFTAPEFVDFMLETHQPNLIFDPTRTPCYIPKYDTVVMPPIEQFKSPEGFAATLLHEMAHWTGHKSRLNRKQVGFSNSPKSYAFEELVAEMTSAIVCAEYGLAYALEKHASYIQHWIDLLQNQKTTFVAALKEAAKASEFLTRKPPEEEE